MNKRTFKVRNTFAYFVMGGTTIKRRFSPGTIIEVDMDDPLQLKDYEGQAYKLEEIVQPQKEEEVVAPVEEEEGPEVVEDAPALDHPSDDEEDIKQRAEAVKLKLKKKA